MKEMILLDTHVWWWAVNEPGRLSDRALKLIHKCPPGQRAIASISIWEFAMMVSKAKVEIKIPPEQWLDHAVNKTGIHVYDLNPKVVCEACNLPGKFHSDPADRIIVATARINSLTLISKDRKILEYPFVDALW